jgi:four helix bundle protein
MDGLRFRQLIVWKEAVMLAQALYRLTASFPRDERFGLSSQIRRAAVSVPSNIAEGSVRTSRKDFARFVEMSLGSLAEIETQIEIANAFNWNTGDRDDVEQRIVRVRKMLYRLREALKSESNRGEINK